MAKIDYTYYHKKDLYSDGDIENELLEIVSTKTEEEIADYLLTDSRWPIYYHLSKKRRNILDPIDITKEDSVLEIGSGCGAITTGLVKKAKDVTCVELSKRRTAINYERNKEYDNLLIYVGNFDEVVLPKKYDKIFLIGVLEYAKLYYPNQNNPFVHLLKKVKSLLNEGGALYIAIENKYGMKYFSGASEDHLGTMFESIEGYKNNVSVETFSSFQLRSMIKESGFDSSYFYYPLPDYKFPVVIYSEDYLPLENEIKNVAHALDRPRYIMFDESKALNESVKSGTFDVFCNSFLIMAK